MLKDDIRFIRNAAEVVSAFQNEIARIRARVELMSLEYGLDRQEARDKRKALTTMKIPAVRAQMRALANTLAHHGMAVYARKLRRLASALKRRTNGKTKRRVSPKITPALRRTIRLYRQQFPHLTQQEIATAFGVNNGRVSEILHGKRK